MKKYRQKSRFLALHGSGRNQKIGRMEERDRKMVRSIVEPGEIEDYVQLSREQYYALGDYGIASLRRALETNRNPKLAAKILKDFGVATSKPEPLVVQPERSQEEVESEAWCTAFADYCRKKAKEVPPCEGRDFSFRFPPSCIAP